mgnify:CR=1 FL=1
MCERSSSRLMVRMSRPSRRIRARVDFVEAHQKIDDRRLSRSGGTDDRDHLPGLHLDRKVMDDGLFRIVAKAHVLELHVSLARRRVGKKRGLVAHLGLVENLEDALGAGNRGLEGIDDARQLADGPCEVAHVLRERLYLTDGERADDRLPATYAHYGDVGEVAHEDHERANQARDELRAMNGPEILVIDALEVPDRALFVRERLDLGVSAVSLLDVRVQHAKRGLLGEEEPLRAFRDDGRERDGDGQRAQRDDGDERTHEHHHDKDADDGDDRRERLRHAVLQRRRDEVDVVDDAREDVTLRMRVVIGQRDAVELLLGLLT